MKPRILFIGGTLRGLELIKLLLARKETIVLALILKEDRHETVKASQQIKRLCQASGIPCRLTKKISVRQVRQILGFKPETAFVCGWRTMIPQNLFSRIPLGCFAAHDSLLPRYRGFAPLNWAIINGEKKTGVTLFKIEKGTVDSGRIFAQKAVAVSGYETAQSVYVRIIEATLGLYKDLLSAIRKGGLRLSAQDEGKATYCCPRIPDDGRIDWNKNAGDIFNLIRALAPPYPCAWTYVRKKKVYISSASLPEKFLSYVGNIPGRPVAITGNGVLVLCGSGQIILRKCIVEKGREVPARKVIDSIKITLGV